MKKNRMRRNLLRSIQKSIARYIAIMAIIALGSAIFVGLRTTKSDMIATGQHYMDQQNMFDLRLLSTYGWSLDQPEKIAELPGVAKAEGVIHFDAIISFGDGKESVFKLYSLPDEINKTFLHSGRMPQNPGECVIDAYNATEEMVGKEISLSVNNEDEPFENLKVHSFTVVGLVSTPLYMDISRGNTTLANGTLTGFLYLPRESFATDYYTEIAITLEGDRSVYTEAYHDRVQAEADRLTPMLEPFANDRYETVLQDAKAQYQDGLEEYEKGLSDYKKGKQEAFDQLDEARTKLQDGDKELNDNQTKLEQGKTELEENEKKLEEGKTKLAESKVLLSDAKAKAYSEISKANAELMRNYQQVDSALTQVNDGLAAIDSGISQIESGISQLDLAVTVTEALLNVSKTTLSAAETALEIAKQQGADEETLSQLRNSLDETKAQVVEYETQLSAMKVQREELTVQLAQLQAQRAELAQTKATLDEAKNKLDQGLKELELSRSQADDEFKVAEAEIEKAERELEAGLLAIEKARKDLDEGFAQLEEAKLELQKGWKEYNEGFVKASKEMADAWIQLEDARLELVNANKTIEKMEAPQVFALGRVANMGYLALENNSDIVEGVSAVFPAFFLLIAALVCITTMTRMVEDERTEIGTLKAIGYSSAAIMSKYLIYAGSAAVIGCGLGVAAGSVVFPLILWDAYQIIMMLGDYFLLQIDWVLCILVVVVYTAVTLLVTWYCCKRSLKEVPAELIRPKAPAIGKSVLLEKLPIWNRLSFLNKVMLRNIFRYRQRLFMMLIGVGGCTALLLTGFGIRDSIGDLADIQFDEIILYDHEIRFSEEMDQNERVAFEEHFADSTDGILFYHQSSMELYFGDQMANVNFVVSDNSICDYISFHRGKQTLSMPGDGEAIISVGMAERFGIRQGDTVTLRDDQMQTLSLVVAGIFDNNVYNYVITTPRTVEKQWGYQPEVQMACIYAAENVDPYELGADFSEYEGIMNVTVNEDVRTSVGQMLDALDLVVVTVVICATMLAVIVTYNLTNINITERIREIATIKVLGFRPMETASYVFKENMLLSFMGAAFGLGGGVLLLKFVISQIQVDFVWLTDRLATMSFVLAVVITLLAALIVDFVLYFKLKKINMAEALKSVE